MPRRKTRNKFEERTFKQLAHHGVTFSYEGVKLPYVLKGNYIPDYIIVTPIGKIYIETKGYFRPEAKRKMVAVKKQHPELDIRILFYAPNKSYIKWAEKHGFKYAFREIPQDWFEEFS